MTLKDFLVSEVELFVSERQFPLKYRLLKGERLGVVERMKLRMYMLVLGLLASPLPPLPEDVRAAMREARRLHKIRGRNASS